MELCEPYRPYGREQYRLQASSIWPMVQQIVWMAGEGAVHDTKTRVRNTPKRGL